MSSLTAPGADVASVVCEVPGIHGEDNPRRWSQAVQAGCVG